MKGIIRQVIRRIVSSWMLPEYCAVAIFSSLGNEPHHALRRLAKAKAGSAPKLKRVQELRAQAVREDHLTPAGLARPGHLVRKIING